MRPNYHSSMVYTNQDMEATRMPNPEFWIMNGILLNHKKNENLPFLTMWMMEKNEIRTLPNTIHKNKPQMD